MSDSVIVADGSSVDILAQVNAVEVTAANQISITQPAAVVVTESIYNIDVSAPGPAGAGVPTGGTAGQVLSKINSTNYNTQWTTIASFVPYDGATDDLDLGSHALLSASATFTGPNGTSLVIQEDTVLGGNYMTAFAYDEGSNPSYLIMGGVICRSTGFGDAVLYFIDVTESLNSYIKQESSGDMSYTNAAGLHYFNAGLNIASGAMVINTDGSIQPASLTNAAAPNNSIYYSTTAAKLVYKNSAGTVNALY